MRLLFIIFQPGRVGAIRLDKRPRLFFGVERVYVPQHSTSTSHQKNSPSSTIFFPGVKMRTRITVLFFPVPEVRERPSSEDSYIHPNQVLRKHVTSRFLPHEESTALTKPWFLGLGPGPVSAGSTPVVANS